MPPFMMQRFALGFLRRSSTPSWLAASSALDASRVRPSPAAPGTPALPPSHVNAAMMRSRSSRSRRGLYDGKDVRFGNNVPFSMKKTRRRWNPNVQEKRVYSEILDAMIPFHLTTSALRSIDKYGGLDQYLLKSQHVGSKG